MKEVVFSTGPCGPCLGCLGALQSCTRIHNNVGRPTSNCSRAWANAPPIGTSISWLPASSHFAWLVQHQHATPSDSTSAAVHWLEYGSLGVDDGRGPQIMIFAGVPFDRDRPCPDLTIDGCGGSGPGSSCPCHGRETGKQAHGPRDSPGMRSLDRPDERRAGEDLPFPHQALRGRWFQTPSGITLPHKRSPVESTLAVPDGRVSCRHTFLIRRFWRLRCWPDTLLGCSWDQPTPLC